MLVNVRLLKVLLFFMNIIDKLEAIFHLNLYSVIILQLLMFQIYLNIA
jgi:hypothetical protein